VNLCAFVGSHWTTPLAGKSGKPLEKSGFVTSWQVQSSCCGFSDGA